MAMKKVSKRGRKSAAEKIKQAVMDEPEPEEDEEYDDEGLEDLDEDDMEELEEEVEQEVSNLPAKKAPAKKSIPAPNKQEIGDLITGHLIRLQDLWTLYNQMGEK